MLDCTLKFFYTQYMLTLSNASKSTKEILKWAALIIAAIILLIMAIRLVVFGKNLFFPSPPPKPDVSFGKLQQQAFPQGLIDKDLKYTVNTLTGELPSAPSQTKVFRMQTIQPDLLALKRFDQQVKNIGFESGYKALSDKVFEWNSNPNLSNLDRRLRINIVTYGFTIISAFTSDETILSAKDLPSEERAKTIAQSVLENMQSLPSDIDLSKTKTNLFSIKNGALSKATSLSNTQVIGVDFVQGDINKLPIFYENPSSSNISVFIGAGGNQGQVVAANYSYQKVSEVSSTYPIKNTKEAFDDLKSGKGVITSYSGGSSNILINNVFLAYYIGNQPQDFLMPIYVFAGNDDFYAYVEAVTDEWINR